MDRSEALDSGERWGRENAAVVRRIDEVDWDFPDQVSDSLFSDIHWHPGRFPSQLPAVLIGRLTSPGDFVLDPFVGSGTTVVEAQRLGRHSVGIDINPIAYIVTKAKTLRIKSKDVDDIICECKKKLCISWDEIIPVAAPDTVQKDKWYTISTLKDLERIWGYICACPPDQKILLEAAFSAILLSCCRETRHWGYVCDNTMPKSTRERNVRAIFFEVLDKFARAYSARDNDLKGELGHCEMIHGNSLDVLQSLPSDKFSCALTSPPYFGVADYVKSQRLSMEWFQKAIEPSRLIEIGARSKRRRLTAYADYLDDLTAVFEELYRVLRRGGWTAIIYGESPKRASPKDEFAERLKKLGFQICLQKIRRISPSRRQFPSLKEEDFLLLTKGEI